MTSTLQRITRALIRPTDPAAGYAPILRAPERQGLGEVTLNRAAVIPSVYRALQIITGSAAQISLDVERGGQTLTGQDIPAIIRRPSLEMSRSEFVSQLVMSLATTGNAYMFRSGGQALNETAELTPLIPGLVQPFRNKAGEILYSYDGRTYGPDRIQHMRLITLPGSLIGVGPIQAAQTTMAGTSAMRDYASGWWDHGQPSGILTTDAALTGEDVKRYRDAWNQLDENGKPLDQSANPSRVRVLGKGLEYTPIMISPKDSLWLEAQAFDTLEIARVFGVPASLMLTTPDGGSMTYANVSQEWLAFVRFTLMSYLRPIEEALTALTARGQEVRFNVESLLRSDTSSRYEAHAQALQAGFLTIDEVRAIEHLPPLTPTQTPAPEPAESKETTQ